MSDERPLHKIIGSVEPEPYVPEANPETEADVDRLIFEPDITMGSKYHDAGSCWHLIEAMRRRLIAATCRDDTDAKNAGADLAAERLLAVARTGEHAGTFGGEKMEECAQAILRCHRKADEAIRKALSVQRSGEEIAKRLMLTPGLFRLGDFRLAGGGRSAWKIECDALGATDWAALAQIAASRVPPFGSVVPVPRGGIPFAEALAAHATEGPPLVADDVLTTGGSVRRALEGGAGAHAVVVFARGPVPVGVTALFALAPERSETC